MIIDLIEVLDLIDQNALNEKKTEEPLCNFWAPSWTQDSVAANAEVVDDVAYDIAEETPKTYTGGLKLKV